MNGPKLGQGMSPTHINVIHGTIDLFNQFARDMLVPSEDLFVIGEDEIITRDFIKTFHTNGFSSLPVMSPDKSEIIGVLKAKSLVGVRADIRVTDIQERVCSMPSAKEDLPVIDVLTAMMHSNVNMAEIKDVAGKFVGVVTIKSILSKIASSKSAGMGRSGELNPNPIVQHHIVVGNKQIIVKRPLEESLLA